MQTNGAGYKIWRWAVLGLVAAGALTGSTGFAQQGGQAIPMSAKAENDRGVELALVLGPGRSLKDARKCFERGAREGYAPAQVNLAVMNVYGLGMPQNYGAALYWLKSAAESRNPQAYTNLGILYLKGWGVQQNYAEARKYFELAAEAGDTGAMVNLGYLADGGLGSAVDHKAAAEYYRHAAERGDALGQNNLADLYLRGEGVAQSDAQAFAWFEKAAEQGNTGARIKLGFMYANGRATKRDEETAYAYILAASIAGDARGVEYVRAIGAKLSAEQLESATKRAKAMQVAPVIPREEMAFVK